MSKMDEKDDDDNIDVYLYKIILLGDSFVGKTSLIIRFCDDLYEDVGTATIGVDTKTKFIKRKDKKIQLQIWDTAGQERFRSLAKNCTNQMDGIILVYDINQKETFQNIKIWYNNLRDTVDFKKVGFILVGNKSDMPRDVSQNMAEEFSNNHNITFIEASAKDNKNVSEIFVKLIDIMVNINPKKPKSKMGNLNNSNDEDNIQPKKKKCC